MSSKHRLQWQRIAGMLLFMAVCILAVITTQFDLGVILERGSRFFDILRKMFPPDTGFAGRVMAPLFATIQMSVAGTVLGSVLALMAAVLCAKNVNHYSWVRIPVRMCINVLRGFPTLILALICTFIFGIGTFAGMTAITIYTFAIMTRLGYEDIENTPMNTFSALNSMGAGRTKAFVWTILPDMLPGFVNNALYLLETNVRHAAILGYVGAGGLGILLNEKIAWREYSKAGMILLILYGAVVIIELLGGLFRRWIMQDAVQSRLSKILVVGLVLTAFVYSIMAIGVPHITENGMLVVKQILSGLLHPDTAMLFDFTGSGVAYLVYETLCISVLGTILGVVIALPLSMLGSTTLMPAWAAYAARIVMMAIRTVPVFIYGLMFIRVTGPGAFAGVLTLGMCSVGLLCKRFIIAIDRVDKKAWDAYAAMGISRLSRIRYVILPEVLPELKAACFYRFDVNIREASVLGLVGAGGIGAPLIMAFNNYRWNEAGALLLGLIAVILLVDFRSNRGDN